MLLIDNTLSDVNIRWS